MTDIVFAITGNPAANSRALRQLGTFENMGLQVHVVSAGGASIPAGTLQNAEHTAISLNRSGGPAFFREVSHKMEDVLRTIETRHYHASDLFVLGAVARTAGARARTYSYDARELYPHVASTRNRPWVRLWWHLVQSRYIRRSSAVFTVSGRIADHMARTHGIKRPIVVPNFPEMRPVAPSEHLRREAGLAEDTPIILHLGQLQKSRGCDVLVRALRHCDRGHLVFLGSGPEDRALRALARETGVSARTHFLDAVPPDTVLDAASSATVGVTLLQDTCLNHRYALPNKLFEYLAAGIPVLASDLPEISEVIRESGAGRVVHGASAAAVGGVLSEMLGDPERLREWRRNAERSRETFNWRSASQPFSDAFEHLLQVPAR